jgi:tetratricopeptide (TPR) repeat protein
MTTMTRRVLLRSVLVFVPVAGCSLASACNGPRVIHESPILATGERVPDAARESAATAAGAVAMQSAQRAAADSAASSALAGCAADVCAALARGEVALGMTEAQVLAATRSAPAAWSARRGGASAVLVPASLAAAPGDARGEISLVQLAAGRVTSVAYREGAGVRVVQSAADATLAGRAAAEGRMLLAEGDRLAAAGQAAAALDRYDRALVLLPDEPLLQYRIATLLDQQLRPIEALMRYQRFLNQLEIQRIDATGNAYAKLADAIARARERVIILEKQAR